MGQIKSSTARQLLKEAGVKQKQIALFLGVSTQAVNQVVLGQRSTRRIRETIAKLIGKPVAEIWPDQSQEDNPCHSHSSQN
jgi:predicted transcriptional regulator